MRIDRTRTAAGLLPRIDRLFELSAARSGRSSDAGPPAAARRCSPSSGRYTARGWTEWTQGFQFGSALLQFDATGDREFLDLGRERTLDADGAAPHPRRRPRSRLQQRQHLRRPLAAGAGRTHRRRPTGRCRFYELALKVSGAVQARRWTPMPGGGYIYSFNGAHSLFVDTIRSLRALALSHQLGHRLIEEQDAQINLLDAPAPARAGDRRRTTCIYGRGPRPFDVRGRVAHESLFNVANGTYRGPSTQQGYSPFSTWTRGLAWAMLGFAEQLEFLATLPADAAREPPACADAERGDARRRARHLRFLHRSRRVRRRRALLGHRRAGTGARSATGARAPADPFNDREPVDSSAAAIAAQGLLRFGHFLDARGEDGSRYTQAGLRVLETLFDDGGPYLSQDAGARGSAAALGLSLARTGGTTCRPARASRAANRASGATITRARWRSTCSGSRTSEPYLTFYRPAATRRPPGRARHWRHPRHRLRHRAGARRATAGISSLSGVRPAADVAPASTRSADLAAASHYCAADIASAADRARARRPTSRARTARQRARQQRRPRAARARRSARCRPKRASRS